jgi:hypothetical protein
MQKFSELFNKSFKYLVAATLIIVPLYPKFPFINIPGTYVSIRFEDFLLAITAIFTLIKILPNIRKVFSDNVTRAMIVFLLVGLVSLSSGIFLTQTVVPSIGVLHLLRRVEYFVPFFAILAFFPYERTKNLEFYIKVLMLTVFVSFLYGIGQKYLRFPVIVTQDSESSKGIALRWAPGAQITSTFAGHYDLASFMVLVLPIFICLIFTIKAKLSKIFLAVASLSGYWLLINTASRISLASYLFGVCISLFLIKKYKAILIVVIVSLVLSGFSTSLFARYKSLIDVYFQKIKAVKIVEALQSDFVVSANDATATNTAEIAAPTPAPVPVIEDRSTSIRFNVEWPRAIRSFIKDPLIGTGYSSIGLASDNDYLRLLAEVGILGFLGFALIIVRIMLVFTSSFPITERLGGIKLGFVAGVIGGIFGTLINAVFIDVFEASKLAIIFWLLTGLAVYTVKGVLYENKN